MASQVKWRFYSTFKVKKLRLREVKKLLKVTQQGSGRVKRRWLWVAPRKSLPENYVEEPPATLLSQGEYV